MACARGATEGEIRARLDEKRYLEAFELVLSEYQNKVFRLAFSMLGNHALAEDTAQDIFIRIWKALAAYRRQASLSTWIYAIARNACLTARKSAAARSAMSLDDLTRASAGRWTRTWPPALSAARISKRWRRWTPA